MTTDTGASMMSDQIPLLDASIPLVRTRRALVVDDHARTLTAVAALLQQEFPYIDVVGTASNGNVALQIVRDTAPDVVVLDLELGDEYGLDLMPALTRFPGVEVIVLSSSDDLLTRKQALSKGARAFVSKFSPGEELIAAILALPLGAAGTGVLSWAAGSAEPGK